MVEIYDVETEIKYRKLYDQKLRDIMVDDKVTQHNRIEAALEVYDGKTFMNTYGIKYHKELITYIRDRLYTESISNYYIQYTFLEIEEDCFVLVWLGSPDIGTFYYEDLSKFELRIPKEIEGMNLDEGVEYCKLKGIGKVPYIELMRQ